MSVHGIDARTTDTAAMRFHRLVLPTLSWRQNPLGAVVLSVAVFLTVFGTVMVLSASSVEEIAVHQSPFAAFTHQLMFALVGLPLMFLASRVSAASWKRWALPIFSAGVFLELLVLFTPLGMTVQGNRNWLRLGAFSAQPSELIKLGLVLMVAAIVDRKREAIRTGVNVVREVYVPVIVTLLVGVTPVLLGKDLGTSIVIVAAVFGVVVFSGVRIRDVIIGAAGASAVVALLAMTRSSRAGRITTWMSGCGASDQTQAACWQPVHAQWALASGGIFGKGLGDSMLKWSWLPEADNDFIYAIIGEELGLIGACTVLALFIVIAIALIRTARGRSDVFGSAASGGILAWVVGEALINIAVVLGLLPVLGVPLPLISAGGSSMVVTLIGLGAAASFAQREPTPAPVAEQRQPKRSSETAFALHDA